MIFTVFTRLLRLEIPTKDTSALQNSTNTGSVFPLSMVFRFFCVFLFFAFFAILRRGHNLQGESTGVKKKV